MTQVQKIIASALGAESLERGKRIYIKKKENFGGISFDDKLCGAYGKVYIDSEVFSVPDGIFIDLCGVLRNDAGSMEIAEYFKKSLKRENFSGMTVEIGGDSMSYLTMDDRFAVVKAMNELSAVPFCTVFECDYITAEYTLENLLEKPAAFFNSGPQNYERIIRIDLGLV